MINSRAIAAHVIQHVVDAGNFLTDSLSQYAQLSSLPARDQALVQAICYGVCRDYPRLAAIARDLLKKPLKAKDQDIYQLILVGIYQLLEMRLPAHAAIAETVAATQVLKKIWAKGLVNAVLRNFQRHQKNIMTQLAHDPVAFYAHPLWLLTKLQQTWPHDWQAIVSANNQRPPFALRVNQQRLSRDAYMSILAEHALVAYAIPDTYSGIVLEKPLDVLALPGFAQGDVSVQDGAAQLAAQLLNLAPGQRVLDACAAPGGKTTHILELQANLAEVVAIDQSSRRIQAVQANLKRLKLSATCKVADAGNLAQWWQGERYDRILLDAPCSATGIIRRHPDIKLLRTPAEIESLVCEQERLLRALWPLLVPDGLLLYVTCSILAEENVQVVQRFLAEQSTAREVSIQGSWGKPCLIGKQILPGMQGMDGFYFAALTKCEA